MKKTRIFFTVLFLLTSVGAAVIITVINPNLMPAVMELIKNNIWAAVAAALLFLGLFSAGVVSNHGNPDGSLVSNGFFQLAVLELFLCSAGLIYFNYYMQQPGQIILQLSDNQNRNQIMAGVSSGTSGSHIDTVYVPGVLSDRPAGQYTIKTLDPDIVPFRTDVKLKPGEVKTVLITVAVNTKKLRIQSEPSGAQIWLNGLETAQTPHTFDVLTGDTVIVELKLPGYQVFSDTIRMTEAMDLGIVNLVQMHLLRISSQYDYTSYHIFDSEGQLVYSASGSRKIELPDGKYRLSYEIGEGQYKTKYFTLNANSMVTIP
jgi:hypothetical protein